MILTGLDEPAALAQACRKRALAPVSKWSAGRRRSLGNYLRNREGVAALELALLAPVLLIIAGGLADFGLAFGDSTQLAHAVANGAAYAFAAQQAKGSIGSVSASGVQAAVQASTALPNVTVQVAGPEPGCIQMNSTASPPTSTLVVASSAYGTPCPNGNPVGTYMVITAQYTYQPLMPFYSGLASQALTASATVRLY